MARCPYCCANSTDSRDHIFPRFLGGTRTIPACRACNSKFGHSFESEAARELEPIYVQLAKWGVPLPPREQVWRNAYDVEGVALDLSVGTYGVRASSGKPIIVRDDSGSIIEAYFPDPASLARFNETVQHRQPDARWMPAEKRVSTDLSNLRWSLSLGFAIKQLALKIAVATAALLPGLDFDELKTATLTLHGPPCDPHPVVAHYVHDIRRLSAKRPPLAHSVYVEWRNEGLHGLVEIFGALRLFVDLPMQRKFTSVDALIGYVDPITKEECFEETACLELPLPPPYHTAEELVSNALGMMRRLAEAACARGATGNPEINLTITLPSYPAPGT